MVSKIIEETQKFIGPFELKDPFGLILIIRELLMNAVIHGNKSIPERIIRCRIEKLEKKKFRIEVEDEGRGFDFKSLEMKIPEDPKYIRNRGYALINALSDQIEFNSQGNHITAYVTIN